MRVLLIGGNGFIGRFVAIALRDQGHHVAIFHRVTSPVPKGVSEIIGDRNRLTHHASELRTFQADIVVDFVVSSGAQAEQLVDIFRGLASRIVMLSSMDVYRAVGIGNETETGPLQDLPLTEDSELRHNLHPYQPGSLQMLRQVFTWVTDDYDKIPAERVVMNQPNLTGTVLRLPMIYGPGDRLHRFYPIVKRISDGRRNIIFADTLGAWRSPRGYVENVAAAIALAVVDSRAAGRIYNICEEPASSELEWAEKIAKEMQWDGKFVVLPVEGTPQHLLRPGNAAQHWTASSARIRRELGYLEPIPVEEGIRRTIAWECENPPAVPLVQFDYAAEDAALGVADSTR
jgi:nucleoside-diphosphate-sugar epimerase